MLSVTSIVKFTTTLNGTKMCSDYNSDFVILVNITTIGNLLVSTLISC